MPIVNNSAAKKALLVIFSCVLVIAFGIFVLEKLQIINLYKKPNSSAKPITDFDNSNNQDKKSEPIPENSPTPKSTDETEVIQRNSTYTPPASGQITITRLEASTDMVTVAALVQGFNTGECSVVYSQNGSEVTGSSKVQQGPSYFACQIDIPKSKFTKAGVWKALLKVNQDDKANSATGEVTI